jgi:hypothetical protein
MRLPRSNEGHEGKRCAYGIKNVVREIRNTSVVGQESRRFVEGNGAEDSVYHHRRAQAEVTYSG